VAKLIYTGIMSLDGDIVDRDSMEAQFHDELVGDVHGLIRAKLLLGRHTIDRGRTKCVLLTR
jgi:hypothetical protein